jgi:hypothetical protein
LHYYYLHIMTLGKISKRNNEKNNSTITVYSTCEFWAG